MRREGLGETVPHKPRVQRSLSPVQRSKTGLWKKNAATNKERRKVAYTLNNGHRGRQVIKGNQKALPLMDSMSSKPALI